MIAWRAGSLCKKYADQIIDVSRPARLGIHNADRRVVDILAAADQEEAGVIRLLAAMMPKPKLTPKTRLR